MTTDEENAIVNTSAETLMKQLTTDGNSVEAVVTVVLYRGGERFHIGSIINPTDEQRTVLDEESTGQVEGRVLLAASDLLNDYVHEQGLCADCNSKNGTVQ